MAQIPPIGSAAMRNDTAPERWYPGLSPQLLARIKQLWSSAGLDFDATWRLAARNTPGFQAVSGIDASSSSEDVDLVFLFDQCLIWALSVHSACDHGRNAGCSGLTQAQWHGLAALSARLAEQMAALRLLALTDLPMPAMQIARSLSEDVDMALVLLIRPKLAAQFASCQSAEDATDFWRRHIAGGRAFRSVSEKLYAVGIDHSADTDYAKWRKSVLTTLGAAVHSNALKTRVQTRHPEGTLLSRDSLHFATFRVQELCAFAQLVEPSLTKTLAQAASDNLLAGAAAPLSTVLVNQIPSLTASPGQQHPASSLH